MKSPITAWREADGLSQADVCALVLEYRGEALDQGQLSHWENDCKMRRSNAVMFERISKGKCTVKQIESFARRHAKAKKDGKLKARRAKDAAYTLPMRTGELLTEVQHAIADGQIDEQESARIAARCEAVRATATEVQSASAPQEPEA